MSVRTLRDSLRGRDRGAPDEATLRAAVDAVIEPHLMMTLAEAELVQSVDVPARGPARVSITLPAPDGPERSVLDTRVREAVQTIWPDGDVLVVATPMDEPGRMALGRRLRSRVDSSGLGGSRRVYAIASGKGGVGKSSVTANLAVSLAGQGLRVGVLDADVWGYSVPQLFGVRHPPVAIAGMMLPLWAHGVQLMSVGFFVQDDEPVMWRGPMLHKAIEQFVHDVAWGELDVLLVDLPPGTGDVQLSLLEQLPDAAFVVVTTPQAAAVEVAARVGRMALDARLPIAGVVENMAGVACSCCGSVTDVFGTDGGTELAQRLDSTLLGSVPLDRQLRTAGDDGVPVVLGAPDAPAAVALAQVAAGLPVVRRSLVGRSLPLSVL